MKNILVFPAGSEIAHEIFNALRFSKFVKLFGATSVNDHSEFWFKNIIYDVPYITDETFIKVINDVIEKYEIDYIYPAHDSVNLFLSKNRDSIHATVIASDYKTTLLCRSKSRTYDYFLEEDFIPRVYEKEEEIDNYPVFVKPDIGEGSKGARIVYDKADLNYVLNQREKMVICEYLSGDEYTIDCFTDRHGNLLSINARTRERIRDGISVRSRNVILDNEIVQIANIINDKLNFRGAWFFQLKKNKDNRYILLEISPRIPGTMGLSRNRGINYPLLTLFDLLGFDVEIITAPYDIEVDRALDSSYRINYLYDNVYLDVDDTLVINNEVNTYLMMFLYQCVNKNIKIHVLTKHRGSLQKLLSGKCIDERLFAEICILRKNEEKYKKIKEKKSIFIDDSFAERKKVFEKVGIPVFDVDMVECLIDWRR